MLVFHHHHCHCHDPPRGLKSLNFPVGRLLRAKTFRTKCVNSFRDKWIKKVRKSFSRHVCQKRVNRFFRHVSKCVNCPETFQTVRKPYRLSKNFPDSSETFQTVRKVSWLSEIFSMLSGNYSDCSQTFFTVRKFSRLSRNFLDSMEAFQTVQKPSRLSENFPNFQKLSRLFRNFPDCPETFQTYAMFWLDFGPILYICAKTFRTRKNFPVGNANAPTDFFWLWASLG